MRAFHTIPGAVAGALLLAWSGAAHGWCPEEMTEISTEEGAICVDRYEASRADATLVDPGADNASAPRSIAGVMPWAKATLFAAETACANASKRLCSFEELRLSCAGPTDQLYPYGEEYDPQACNGHTSEIGAAVATASFEGCQSPSGAFDLIGNLKEWTSTVSSSGKQCTFGGDFNAGDMSVEENLASETCTPEGFYCISLEEVDQEFISLGFRCCQAASDEPPPEDTSPEDASNADAANESDAGVSETTQTGDGGSSAEPNQADDTTPPTDEGEGSGGSDGSSGCAQSHSAPLPVTPLGLLALLLGWRAAAHRGRAPARRSVSVR